MLFEFSSQLQLTSRLHGRVGKAPVNLRTYVLRFSARLPTGIEDRVIDSLAPESLPCQLNSQFMGQLHKSLRVLACRRFRGSLNLADIRIAIATREHSQCCDRTCYAGVRNSTNSYRTLTAARKSFA